MGDRFWLDERQRHQNGKHPTVYLPRYVICRKSRSIKITVVRKLQKGGTTNIGTRTGKVRTHRTVTYLRGVKQIGEGLTTSKPNKVQKKITILISTVFVSRITRKSTIL